MLLIEVAKSNDVDRDVRNEACWAVLNATSCGTVAQVEYLVKHG